MQLVMVRSGLWPEGQAVQLAAPALAAILPAGHSVQALLPPLVLKLPALQGKQLPDALVWPGPQPTTKRSMPSQVHKAQVHRL